MTKLLKLVLLALLLSGCSRGKLSFYQEGDLSKRTFLTKAKQAKLLQGDYYEVRRDPKGQVISAKHLTPNKHLIEKSSYKYARNGTLLLRQHTEYFPKGLPRVSREWIYEKGQVVRREEKWFTRSRSLEKKLTYHYNADEKIYLEETWGLANKIESSTEYYYDYKHRLDKSRRNFFHLDGNPRDYWLTIYNDQVQIVTEEHYFPDNSLIAFYRYAYHPVKRYREREEFLDADRNIFISRKFDEYGLILEEDERDREMAFLKRTVFEYNDKHQPKLIHHYNADGELIETLKYKKPRYLEKFRTPGS